MPASNWARPAVLVRRFSFKVANSSAAVVYCPYNHWTRSSAFFNISNSASEAAFFASAIAFSASALIFSISTANFCLASSVISFWYSACAFFNAASASAVIFVASACAFANAAKPFNCSAFALRTASTEADSLLSTQAPSDKAPRSTATIMSFFFIISKFKWIIVII